MNTTPSGEDPIIHALDELVRAGQIPPERARAAYDGSLGHAPPPAGQTTAQEGEPDRQLRFETIAIAVGVGLVGATIGIASGFSRQESDLDWSNFALGVIGSVGLLAVAAVALLLVKDDQRKANLAALPGAVGAIGIGTMLGVLLDDNPATGYVAGAVTAALAAGGYLVVRRGAFVIAAILGLLVLFISLVGDIVDLTDTEGDSTALALSAAILVFTIAITAGGWFLPTRHLSGVFVGSLAVAAYITLMIVITVIAAFQRAFSGLSLDGASDPRPDPDRYNDDIYLTLLFAAILVAGWAVCTVLSDHVGYRVLMLLMVSTVVPLAVAALAVDHPSYWSLGAGVVGAVVLGLAGLRALGVLGDFGKRPPSRPSGAGPINLDQPH